MLISGRSMSSIYRRVCQVLYLYGDDVEARGLMTRELTNVELALSNPRDRLINSVVRKMSMRYMTGEMCFYLRGSTKLDDIAYYGPFWRKVSDDGETVNSAYGYRLLDGGQLGYALRCLRSDPSTRKAVMPIYTSTDAKDSKDNPCTMFLQLMMRKGALDCYTFMRSNDVWLGLPYDAAFFTLLQEIAFVELRQDYPSLRLGTYYHRATSLHCYEEHVDALWDVKREPTHRATLMPEVTIEDVDDWFHCLLNYEQARRCSREAVMPNVGLQGWLAQWLK